MIGFLRFWDILIANIPVFLPYLLKGAVVTLKITGATLVVAGLLGLVLALMQRTRIPVLGAVAAAYIEIMRSVPVLTTLFVIYFGLASIGIQLPSFVAAVIGLGMLGAAYMAEIIRAGIEAVHHGQREAAVSLGMTPAQSMRFIVLPQALRVIVAPTANYTIGLLKDTAIVSTVAAPELLFAAKTLVSQTILPMQVYLLTAGIYLAMSWPLARAAHYLETRLSRGV
jgi:His/Glu/Gln/Arg/opine family amino acid ABC transporter permease subunit